MHAASRSALSRAVDTLSTVLEPAGDPVATAARVGTELFDCVEILDGDRTLRVSVAESSTTGEQRVRLVRDVFGGKVTDQTLTVLAGVVADTWSNPRELRQGLVVLGRRALLFAARTEGRLEHVESELFQLSRVIEQHGELASLLTDRAATAARKRSLLASVVYGKLTATAEALALQAVGRPEHGPVDDIRALSELAAEVRGKTVARVTSAAPLTEAQTEALENKLGAIYHTDIVVHPDIDENLLGGVVVRVGSEVIDGSTAGRVQRLRAVMA